MVAGQIKARGIKDPRVLAAMAAVERHRFVPAAWGHLAYADNALPIGHGQTISQPYIVAWMTALLAPGEEDTVLEVGAGCGYQTAVLARLCQRVLAVERVAALAAMAKENLAAAGVGNAEVREGDGVQGWPGEGPFTRILVAAAATAIPTALTRALAPGGRLVMPVGGRVGQRMAVAERSAQGGLRVKKLAGVAFVPLVMGPGEE